MDEAVRVIAGWHVDARRVVVVEDQRSRDGGDARFPESSPTMRWDCE